MVFGKLFSMPCFAAAIISFASLSICWQFLICYLHYFVLGATADHGSIRSLQFFASSPFPTN
jgi:hypothetical protein